jgi:hypothetical protein
MDFGTVSARDREDHLLDELAERSRQMRYGDRLIEQIWFAASVSVSVDLFERVELRGLELAPDLGRWRLR